MEIKTSSEILKDIQLTNKMKATLSKRWISVESLLAIAPEDLMEEIEDLYEHNNN